MLFIICVIKEQITGPIHCTANLMFYLTLAVTVQLESYVPIERRNVWNSLQTPLLLGQTVDGDQSVAHLQM